MMALYEIPMTTISFKQVLILTQMKSLQCVTVGKSRVKPSIAILSILYTIDSEAAVSFGPLQDMDISTLTL